MFDDTEQVVSNEQVAQVAAPEQTQPDVIDPKQEQKERNLTNMRQALEKERLEREKAENRLRKLEEQIASSQSMEPVNGTTSQTDEDIDIPDDDIVDGRTYKKTVQKIQRKFEEKFSQLESENAKQIAINSLREKYPDLATVLTDENIKNFQALDPEGYYTIMSQQHHYARIKTLYNNVLNSGVIDRAVIPTAYSQGKPSRPAAPKPAASAPVNSQQQNSPLSHVADFSGRRVLTEQMKDQIRRKIDDDKELLRRSGTSWIS